MVKKDQIPIWMLMPKVACGQQKDKKKRVVFAIKMMCDEKKWRLLQVAEKMGLSSSVADGTLKPTECENSKWSLGCAICVYVISMAQLQLLQVRVFSFANCTKQKKM